MGHATSVLGLGRVNRGVANWRIGGRGEAVHRWRSSVGRRLLEAGPRYFVLHSHYLGAVASCVAVAGHE